MYQLCYIIYIVLFMLYYNVAHYRKVSTLVVNLLIITPLPGSLEIRTGISYYISSGQLAVPYQVVDSAGGNVTSPHIPNEVSQSLVYLTIKLIVNLKCL